jgi:hypothetical protein
MLFFCSLDLFGPFEVKWKTGPKGHKKIFEISRPFSEAG